MAQDETYQTTTYHERGGDRYVAGSGGVFAVESGGSMAVYSGGQFAVESGANMELGGADLAGDDMRRVLISQYVPYSITGVDAATTFAVSNLPANANIVTIYPGDSTIISASFWLTSVSAGREVHLHLRGDASGTFTNASCQIDVSTSGCILLGSVGDAISGFEMHTSLASDCGVHLVAPRDNVWAIVSQFGDIDE